MHKTVSRVIFFIVPLTIILSACTEFRKLQKSDDWEKKYEAAIRYYEEQEYFKAATLLEDLLPILRGSQRAELANFYYAYAHYYQEQYLLASHYFKSFFDTFGRSEFAVEAYFMYAYSLYLDSPRYSLDQSSTKEAISALQTFLNRFPKSEYREQATQIIDEMQQKLERKAYENAKLMYRMKENKVAGYLKAAITTFETFQNDYPDSKYNEEIRYLLVEARHLLAKDSLDRLKRERYRETIDAYTDFIEMYPAGPYSKKAENIYDDCINQLEKIKS